MSAMPGYGKSLRLRPKSGRVVAGVSFVIVGMLTAFLFATAASSGPSLDRDSNLGDLPCPSNETKLPNGACCAKANVSGCGDCCTDGLVPDAKTGKCAERPPEMLR